MLKSACSFLSVILKQYLNNFLTVRQRSASSRTALSQQAFDILVYILQFYYINILFYIIVVVPDSFRQPHHCRLDSPPHPFLNSSLSSSTLSSSITPSLFQTFQVSRIGRESHALDVPLTHSRIAYHFSRILAMVTHFG